MLFPPLAWLTTPQLVAALASVGTAAAFEALAYRAYGDDAWLGATWLGAATVTELLSGRLTFAFGLCGAALTALVLQRQRGRLAVDRRMPDRAGEPRGSAVRGAGGRRPC